MTANTPPSSMGIIMLHPFFVPLFNELGLLKEDQFINSDARLKAFAVLRYIVFGNEDIAAQPEVFLKFLCGIEATSFIQEIMPLSDEVIRMIHECLQSFVAHWPALKNTSVESLRTFFFQRQGSLNKEGDLIAIKLEGSGIDILLDQYPWNLSILKLPWIKPLLYVSVG